MDTLELLKPVFLQLLAFGVLFLVIFYILVVRRFRKLFRATIHPEMKALPPGYVGFPPLVADRIQAMRNEIPALGFTECICVEVHHELMPLRCYCVLFKNVNQLETAHVHVAVCNIGKNERLGSSLIFETAYADGECMQTNNEQDLPTFIPLPSCRHTQLPTIGDAPTLYLIHKFLVDQRSHSALKCCPYKTEPPELFLEYQYAELLRMMQNQVKIGRVEFEVDGSTYRMTWTGAAKLVFGFLWPMKPIRMALLRRQSRKLLAAALAR